MTLLTESVLVYSFASFGIGSMVHNKGRELNKVASYEFLFLFFPFLGILALAYAFFGSINVFEERGGLWLTFWWLQTFNAGIVGGFVLAPRYFFKADTHAARILINTASGFALALLFAYTRLSLFTINSYIEP